MQSMTDRLSTGSVAADSVPEHPDPTKQTHTVEEQVLPLYSEEVAVSRHKVERTVHVHVRTRDHAHLIDEALTQEHIEVSHVAIGLPVDAAPPVREEGDVTIIPVIEEVLVVERRLVLKEEIHLRRVRTTKQHRETVTLREQHVVVERPDQAGQLSSPGSDQAPIPQLQALKE